MTTFCLYHANCHDGLAAAWLINKSLNKNLYGPIENHAVDYDGLPPPIQPGPEDTVFIVDFCYDLEIMEQLRSQCKSFIVLDHHPKAQEVIEVLKEHPRPSDIYLFDIDRSGALLTHDTLQEAADYGMFYGYYHLSHELERERNDPLRYNFFEAVSDKDLWRFEHEGTREILAGIGTYPLTLEAWLELPLRDPAFVKELYMRGGYIRQHVVGVIDSIISKSQREVSLRTLGFSESDTKVPLIGVPKAFASETIGRLAIGQPFAVGYEDTSGHRCFSLRSDPNGMDVNVLAKTHGGGGHVRAAGFRVPREHPLAKI